MTAISADESGLQGKFHALLMEWRVVHAEVPAAEVDMAQMVICTITRKKPTKEKILGFAEDPA